MSLLQGALIVLEDCPDEILDILPDLKKFERIIISSRNEVTKTVQKIQDKHNAVEFIPLDFDQVFQLAKQSHLKAMIEFRRWFNTRQLKTFRWMWWLAKPSFRHSFYDRIFNLYLCYELQKLIKDQYLELYLSCYLYTDISLASLVQWPIPTQVITASKKKWSIARSILRDVYMTVVSFFARLQKSLVAQNELTAKTSEVDVCIISAGLPVCWEKQGNQLRDRYYTDLPLFLSASGLKVWHVISPGERCSLISKRREIPSICWNLWGICMAAVQTLASFFMTLIIIVRNRKQLRQAWHWKLLGFYLLTNHKAIFTNLACYHAYKRFIDRHHPRVVLFYDEVYFSGRALEMAITGLPYRKRTITVGMQHGVVSENQLTYFTDIGDAGMPFPCCDYFFVQNELAKKCYSRFLQTEATNHIIITGLHRIEPDSVSGEIQSENLLKGLDTKKPVFLLIGGIPTDMRELWHALAELMHITPLQLIVKPHPSHPFSDDWLEGLRPQEGGRVWYSNNFNLDEVIKKSDYVIATISTSLLNVVSHKRYPIIYHASGRFDVSQMLSWFERQKDGVVVHSAVDLQKVVKRLSGIKPLGPPNFVDENFIMPAMVGKRSMHKIHMELDRILTGQEI